MSKPLAGSQAGAPVPAGPPASLRFHTGGLSVDDGFEAWRQSIVGLYDVRPDAQGGVGAFHMDTTSWHLGQVIAGSAIYGASEQHRDLRRIRADQVDHYRLRLVTSGTLHLDADGRRVVLGAGRMVLTDMARPERTAIGSGTNVSVFVPREVLDEALPRPVDLHGHVPEGALADLLASHLRSLATVLPGLSSAEADLLGPPTVALVAACVTPSAPAPAAGGALREATVLRQACRFIEMNLTDPGLSPARVAAALAVSRPTLYRLFEPLGGVAAYVRERRLERIRESLDVPGAPVHLGRLAERYGFATQAHFSAAFRRQFGCSPSQLVRQGGPGARTRPDAASLDAFAHWLRALR